MSSSTESWSATRRSVAGVSSVFHVGPSIVDELAPKDGDIVIEGKRGLDTFASTNLDFILRSKGIKSVVLGGFLTNCCVESTMRTAYESPCSRTPRS